MPITAAGRDVSTDTYLDLLARVLTGWVYPESADWPVEGRSWLARLAVRIAASRGFRILRVKPFNPAVRESGQDWPGLGYTMVGLRRLQNVREAIDTIEREQIPGDVAECGVWRGGVGMMMQAALRQHGLVRQVWLCDSFAGLPKPNTDQYPADAGPLWDLSGVSYLAVSEDQVRANFVHLGLLGNNVRFVKGLFKDSLPTAPIGPLALLRADGDLYESTMDILTNLYDRVVSGGFIIVDDYGAWAPCKQAIEDFRRDRHITAPLVPIDGSGVYWRKA